jgi:hypothetical protein
VESDYLFANFLQLSAFNSTDVADPNRQVRPDRERLIRFYTAAREVKSNDPLGSERLILEPPFTEADCPHGAQLKGRNFLL